MVGRERLERLQATIALLERHAVQHRAELERLYDLLTVYERALGLDATPLAA